VAVKLGYSNVYRDPRGYPDWQKAGLPVAQAQREAGLTDPNLAAKGPGELAGWAMIWTLLGIFAGGMALNLTPCVYPLIPITVSYFGGQATKAAERSQGRLVMHGLCYLLGLAITNSLLGVIAALTGGLMGSLLQNPYVLLSIAAVLIVFATSLFGFWDLQLPSSLTQAAAKSYSGYFGSLFMGLTLGVVAAPCIGPFVLGLLTWVAGMGSPWLGFIVFFTLSLGLGLPLFVLALFSGQINRLPRSGGWMLWVRRLMGWVLVGMAVHFLRPLMSESVSVFLIAVIVLAAGIYLGWLDHSQADFKAFAWAKSGTAIACLVFATLLIGSWFMRGQGVAWNTYSEEILQQAKQLQKPVIIDFYATWCAPCRELENITFHAAPVVKKAAADFIMIKVDVTKGGDPERERLLQQYEVKGVPTIVFIDRNGREKRELRLVDYLPADQFLSRMLQLQKTDK